MGHWLILLLCSDPMELPLTVALTDISGEGFKSEGFVWAWSGCVKKGKPPPKRASPENAARGLPAARRAKTLPTGTRRSYPLAGDRPSRRNLPESCFMSRPRAGAWADGII